MNVIECAKGHGTENDFVIIPDEGAHIELTEDLVRYLCDRRAGVGGDGVLRVAKAGALVESGVLEQLPSDVDADMWFMDYRNADGSIAEMCGNGVRVFAHWVAVHENGEASFPVGTRAGVRTVDVHSADAHDADVSVGMGHADVLGVSTAHIDGEKFAGLGIDVGNPHLASVVPGLTPDRLRELELGEPVIDEDFFPHGVNVEIVTPLNDSEVSMRVHERGVGETRSCGTGTVAAAVAALADAGRGEGTVKVNVPGGTVTVDVKEDGCVLRGPSRLVFDGRAFYRP